MPTSSSSSAARVARRRLRQAHVDAQRLDDLVADGEDRVEAGHRVLEHEADLAAAELAQLVAADIVRTSRPVEDRPADAPRPAGVGNSPISDIIVTDLPDPLSPTTPEQFARRRSEADAVDRVDRPVAGAEHRPQIGDLEDRRGSVKHP